ncbi:DegT/DnrJ/EryC1/StrS family aminotransferase [Streptomyces zhihengii]|uniref:DegT/DnrJ/EryC1/StrS family aminotransferase n=1 Tax=Streptomyces zhihengii TaxID=1818004 RepID=A0ABS2V623_9ACTN|nr:DegT/DnrJ/EryC1/StrS family aminotransferase [Streptomyces zhihengii]
MPEQTPPGYAQNARPSLYGQELKHVDEVLGTGQFGHGSVTEEFERSVADLLGVPDVVAVSTGTDALHNALAVTGIQPGDEVLVPSMTFCATVQAILAAGATPRFTEVDPATLCLTGADVMDALTPATRAVVPVLYGGRAVDLTDVQAELDQRGITVVEDAAHAFGSMSGRRRVGASGTGLTCFSFGPIKNLTCGQGGAIVPRTREEATAARQMRLLGMVESPTERARSTTYRVERVGIRGHMSQLNAAIGLAQLPHFDRARSERRKLWRTYAAALADVDRVQLVDVDPERSVPSLCAVRVPDRDRVFEIMRGKGIGVGAHYPPNHTQPAFVEWHRPLPVTEMIGAEILTLPFHQHMTSADVGVVVAGLEGALE